MRPAVGTFQRRLTNAAAISAIGGAATLVCTSLAGLLVARAAGPAGYAVFVTANLLVFAGGVAASFGLPVAVARIVGEHSRQQDADSVRRAVSTGLAVGVGGAIGLGLLLAALLGPIERALDVHLGPRFALLLPVALAACVLADTAQAVHYARLRPDIGIALTTAGPIAMVGYIVVGRLTSDSIPSWVAVVISYVVSGALGAVSLAPGRLLSRAAVHGGTARALVREAPSAAAYSVFTAFGPWGDRAVAGVSLGATALGGFTSATILVQAALRAPSYVGFLLIPLQRRDAGVQERGGSFDVRLMAAFGVFAAIATVPLVVAPEAILELTFGPGFAFVADPLRMMAPSVLASAISIPNLSALTGSASHHAVVPLLAATAAIRVVAVAGATAAWGLDGAAVTIALVECAFALATRTLALRVGASLPIRPLVLPYALAAVAAALGALLLAAGLTPLLAAALATLVLAPSALGLVRSVVRA